MKRKVTIYDVAEKTGYSIATVNRALSNKARISNKTKALIIKKAEEMGYKPSKTAAGLSRGHIKIGVVIHNAINAFSDEVLLGIKESFKQLEDFNVLGDIYVTDRNEADVTLEKIKDMAADGVNAIIILPPENDRGLNQAIEKLKEDNIITATVVSDLPSAMFSVRNNGIVAGNIAAEMLKLLVGDKQVAIVTANKEKSVHKDTIDGFCAFASKYGVNLVEIFEHNDNPDAAYHLVDEILKTYPDIGGIYLGSANSTTFCKRIVERGCEKNIKIVASDVFTELVRYLKQDVIQATIFQNPYNQGRLAVRYLYEYLTEGKALKKNIFLDPQLVIKSNVDSFVKNRNDDEK